MFVRFAFDECFASRCFNQVILRQNFQVQREHERFIYVLVPFSFFPNHIESPRFLDRTRTMSSSGIRAIIQTPRTQAERRKSGYEFRSCAFLVLSRSPQPTSPRLIPFRFRARTQNRVHVRKILCRIRRSLAWGHNRWRCRESGKFIRPKSLTWLRRARCARPRNFLLYK